MVFIGAKRLLFLSSAFSLCVLIPIQISLSTRNSKKYASFFFEHATPETLAPRNRRIMAKDIFSLQKSLADLNRIFIDRYITWHHSVLSKVQNGDQNGSLVRKLIFIGNDGFHGLGDQFRGLLFAYMAAVFSDRLLLIKWQHPFPLSTIFVDSTRSNFTYDEALYPIQDNLNGDADVLTIYKAKLTDMDDFIGDEKTILFKCEPRPHFGDIFEAVRKFPNLTTSVEMKKVLPFKARPKPEQFFPLIFKALVRPSAKFRQMMTETIDKHNRISLSRLWKTGPLQRIDTSEPFISIHSRLGFGVGEYKKRFKGPMFGHTMDSVAQCMAEKAMRLASRENISNPARFYLATDTAEFRLKLKRALMRIDRKTKVMYGTWNIKHVKNMREKTSQHLDIFRYTFMDIYIMSKGKAILRSSSGFPNLSVWMGAISSQMQFAIAKDCKHFLS